MFCSWSKVERKKKLALLMEAFSFHHATMSKIYERNEMPYIAPEDIEAWGAAEWQDPER
jgi:hypothetical protein